MKKSYNVLIVSAFGAGIAYGMGEGAEEIMEYIKGISKSSIEEHSDSALISLIALIIVGLIPLIGLFFRLRSFRLTKPLASKYCSHNKGKIILNSRL